MIDIVIVGDINSPITDRCVDTLIESSQVVDHANIFITPFVGYNRSLNAGAKEGVSKLIAFCNNDLDFQIGWDVAIIAALKAQDKIVSASPWCPKTHRQWWGNEVPKGNIVGVQTGKIVSGWCLVLKRSWWEEMGGFDERLEFFCCDNSYTHQLEAANKRHGLIMASQVIHLGSQTLDQFKGTQKYDDLTMGEVRKYNRLYNKNLFNAGT